MPDDQPGSTFGRPGVNRSALFFAATVVCGASAIALWSVESSSSRVFPLLVTSGCLALGAAMGFVLSVGELGAARRVERVGIEPPAAARR